MDDIVEAQLLCRNCSISFNDQEFLIDIIFLPLKKIVMIIGMDWLSSNSVYIGFKENAIFIPTKGATPNDTIDKLIEGTITMVNCLLAQDKSFILTLTADSEDRTSVSEIPVVCEFPEVFP